MAHTGNIGLFLGSGASAQFKIPLFEPMTTQFYDSNLYFQVLLDLIRQNLDGLHFPHHIETILSYARGVCNPQLAIQQSSPFVSHIIHGPNLEIAGDLHQNAERLVKAIEEFIAEACTINEDYRIAEIKDFYGRFWSHLITRFGITFVEKDGYRHPDIDIFTTNYDNVIESYCNETGCDHFDGYEFTAGAVPRALTKIGSFQPAEYSKRGPIRLHKLHGSVTFGSLQNGGVVFSQGGLRVGDEVSGYGRITSRVMIHGFEKQHGQEPYFDQLSLLKQKLKSVQDFLVVGYSFSDEVIRRIFSDVLSSRGPNIKLILLDPNADDIKANALNGHPSVTPITGEFSDFARI